MSLNILLVRGQGGARHWEEFESFLAGRKWVDARVAGTARQAISALEAEETSIVVLDYNLERTNPLALLQRIKTLKPHVEVIFLSSGDVPLSKAVEVMKEGAYDYYEFPITPRLLMAVIEKAVEKQALYFQNLELKTRIKELSGFEGFVGTSGAVRRVIETVRTIARRDVNVLVTGETGTGKELVASAIHRLSRRASKPFIKVNCSAFNVGVLESELFGHEKGAFTGAVTQRLGRFELAEGGTIFLDEVGEIPQSTQVKLLRVLQAREFERVGGNDTVKVDIRLIAATNRNLKTMVEEGEFREDLYYRLNVVSIELPPLRERKEDIPVLVSHFIGRLNSEKGYGIKGTTREAMRLIYDYSWPGNVRELENAVESAAALSTGEMIEAKCLPSYLLMAPAEELDYYRLPKGITLSDAEREIIRIVLQRHGGNRSRAARELGIGLRTLHRRLREMEGDE